MLFNSHIFIFGFLPAVLIGFYLVTRFGQMRVAMTFLIAASLFFYGWWDPSNLLIILPSMIINFFIGRYLGQYADVPVIGRKGLLAVGITGNLLVLAYFKYAAFMVMNANGLFGTSWPVPYIVLPLAISFFTFQKIAFLVDAYRGDVRDFKFLEYTLFVTFFPQMIAGPIVHYREVMHQFADPNTYKMRSSNLAVGATIFAMGLFKKVVFADNIAVYASPVFAAAAAGHDLTFLEAWGGALGYTLQLYFDFSGYSDMALGLGRMFGIRLPINFFSPYKSHNIIEFWRRWHITLSRFLRDYLYIALGGNRRGSTRRYANLMLTMLLGGLWHGAGWTFVMWGALHGFYLMVNHAWRSFRIQLGHDVDNPSFIGRIIGVGATFLAVVIAWVFFRAPTFDAAVNVLEGMAGMNGVVLPRQFGTSFLGAPLASLGITFGDMRQFYGISQIWWTVLLLMVAWFAPNTIQWMASFRPACDTLRGMRPTRLQWTPAPAWAAAVAGMFMLVLLEMNEISEFLYFQF